jgi:hypothetical protein
MNGLRMTAEEAGSRGEAAEVVEGLVEVEDLIMAEEDVQSKGEVVSA